MMSSIMQISVDDSRKKPAPILLAYCANDHVHAMFAYAMAQMYSKAVTDGLHVGLMQIQTTEISAGRNLLVHRALQTEASHILWMDTDMLFPVTALNELLSADKDIVGCTYSKRRSPRGFTHTSLSGDYSVPADDRRYFKVRRMGMGLVLIRREVFERLPGPWFQSNYTGERTDADGFLHVSEDNFFFDHARSKGFDIWCDWHLSQRVKHMGVFEFGPEHVETLITHDIEAPT